MLRFLSGLLIGFFLATGLMFGFVQVYLGPYYSDLQNLKPQVQTAYDITHSDLYGGVQSFVSTISSAASSIANIPFIGTALDASKIPQYSQLISSLMDSAKAISEKVLVIVNFCLFLIQMSLPAIGLSGIMIIVGAGMLIFSLVSKKEQEVNFCGKCGEKFD